MKRKSPKSGKGIIDTYNKFKDIGTKLIYGRKDLSPKVQKVLSEYGDEVIVGATVARKPVTSIIQSIIRTVSSYPYDNLFHLMILLKTNTGKTIRFEKNAAINADVNPSVTNAQYMEVPNVPSGLTINQLIENTRNKMKEKFIPYTASNNNCQNFVLNILRANNMNSPEIEAFVKQDTSMIFKDPNFKKFSDGITGLGEKIDIISQGGKIKFHLNNKMSNELTNHEIDNMMYSRGIKNYHGCFIKDQLPRKLSDGFYIINLNGQSHWTALCKDNKKYYYWDSYGFVAPQDVEDRIGNYYFSDDDIQDYDASSCGFYCVEWCEALYNSKSKLKAYDKFIKTFKQNTKFNDKILGGLL
jgi:hypothetical protein